MDERRSTKENHGWEWRWDGETPAIHGSHDGSYCADKETRRRSVPMRSKLDESKMERRVPRALQKSHVSDPKSFMIHAFLRRDGLFHTPSHRSSVTSIVRTFSNLDGPGS